MRTTPKRAACAMASQLAIQGGGGLLLIAIALAHAHAAVFLGWPRPRARGSGVRLRGGVLARRSPPLKAPLERFHDSPRYP